MGRRKIEIKAIKEERNRSVTFLKRKGGLFKKAHELSVLCSVDIAVIIFGSNKKLYEYSSGDMSDILGRYTYYETPHEHKGPADFLGKGGAMDDDDDDIDMGSPPPEVHEQHMHHQHLQHPGMQHMASRQATGSASPPIHARNLGPYPQRNGTPQPGISRPPSRNAPRRISGSNLNPQQQNGYSYMSGPPVYNHANPHQPMPQGMSQGYQYNPNQQQQPQPPQGQQYDDRRQSMPPVFVQPPRQIQNENPPSIQTNDLHPPSMIEKMPAFKTSRSIFTPIVGPDSELGKFMFPTASDNSRDREHSNEHGRIQMHRKATPPPIKPEDRLRESPKQSPPRSAPLPPVPIEPSQPLPPPPARSNSLPSQPAKRPTLTLTIPSEQQENEAATGDSSPHDAAAGAGTSQQPPTTRPSDAPAGSVVLPPPSPSVTLLSAGATGPVNPFAPRQATTSGPPEQTPLSALPSRFLPGEMLPSPSTFFADWGATFGGRGVGGDMLPSPLNFQTPIAGQPQHNIFKEEPETSNKRKSPSLDSPSDTSASSTKKVKV
ncbi:hypothetical protein BGX38DRAFT_1266624 [Terfezia claveryi]|nr:hypothetical protein BGX38DRAFT_1266624 [Terfezia claveryi]